MNPITLVTLFFGYLLVYAGIANHGHFVGNPWAGVFQDAYTGPEAPAGALGPTGGNGGTSGQVRSQRGQEVGFEGASPGRYTPPSPPAF